MSNRLIISNFQGLLDISVRLGYFFYKILLEKRLLIQNKLPQMFTNSSTFTLEYHDVFFYNLTVI